ncbi:unnamed protein product [Scytosiphon promiscuus]
MTSQDPSGAGAAEAASASAAAAALVTSNERVDGGKGDRRGGGGGGGGGRGSGRGVASLAVGERALMVLLEIVLDARRSSSGVPVATAATSVSADLARREGEVDLPAGMGALSRVLHLSDRGVQGRLESALRRLEAAVRVSQDRGSSSGAASSSSAAGCDGTVYLTGKLVASLFVHLPEARPLLSRMPFFSQAGVE